MGVASFRKFAQNFASLLHDTFQARFKTVFADGPGLDRRTGLCGNLGHALRPPPLI